MLPSCDSERPDSWATHRTLTIPENCLTGSSSETAWANALCCVYTHVEAGSSGKTPILETYDGYKYSFRECSNQGSVTSVDIMEEVMGNVCGMSMGSRDCYDQADCIEDALSRVGPASTDAPTPSPTDFPTPSPTDLPTPSSTNAPTPSPTDPPTPSSTDAPTPSPTNLPTQSSTDAPAPLPTVFPTASSTDDPTPSPTDALIQLPTEFPTPSPTDVPTSSPTHDPTPSPTDAPIRLPTDDPTHSPTGPPTPSPTHDPTHSPTKPPTHSPTHDPTHSPTDDPTHSPTDFPTLISSFGPTGSVSEPPSASLVPTMSEFSTEFLDFSNESFTPTFSPFPSSSPLPSALLPFFDADAANTTLTSVSSEYGYISSGSSPMLLYSPTSVSLNLFFLLSYCICAVRLMF
eukprot:CAMPEP_0201132944 /NCGR_PEP_ID=MMETSP0850-20130426/47384_1 /ASSEMBLY_ACC=CAM_ASM_000622 /TAXON_ID=183588 /ORGANISM="Pseudo-nitzschia fraudulenta, Strain WWA7" /LENGTH=402 /DNA_ID=CAMNT_0047403437 /DNA_START=108 /DNA_END=1316 /DNA_ORIENTATION=-